MGIRDVANSLGYVGDFVDLLFVLDLPLSEAKLAELEQWAGEKSAGYRVVTWVGLPPSEWREAYMQLYILDDLESLPEHREWQDWTADHLEAWLRGQLDKDDELITTLILDGTGAPVATSRLTAKAAPATWASEIGPTVLAEHRGRRLSARVKVANLRRLGRDFPHIRSLSTEVAVTDEAVWAVNDRIGFRPHTH
jgi:RimJ/RimL family protein N-acetyltransferase